MEQSKVKRKKTVDFGKDPIAKILFRLAPPVMLAQLIQALYNIVDSFFVGRNSESGLTALSIVYPLQLLMIALAVGTGVGINTLMAHFSGLGREEESQESAGLAMPLAVLSWIAFALLCFFFMPAYARVSTKSSDVIREVIVYGRIVCVCSIGLFLESGWTKVLQAEGDMRLPMVAQIAGAVVNIMLDPVLIFGLGFVPKMGIAGAAVATVAGQIAAALIVMPKGYRKVPAVSTWKNYIKRIYYLGFPNILMQSAYTFYIFGLNMILKGFSDQAVTTLGLYYKWQMIFFIPLGAMQTCIVPVISYNYGAGDWNRCHKTVMEALLFGMGFMLVTGVLCFETIPGPMLRVFSRDEEVIRIGIHAFHIIGLAFLPLVSSLTFPVFFQAVGSFFQSSFLTVLRTVCLFVPLGYAFSRLGLDWFWLTFPCTEIITTTVSLLLYRKFYRQAR